MAKDFHWEDAEDADTRKIQDALGLPGERLIDPFEDTAKTEAIARRMAETQLVAALVPAVSTLTRIARGGDIPSGNATALKAALWVTEYFMGRGRAAETGKAKGAADWEDVLGDMKKEAEAFANNELNGD